MRAVQCSCTNSSHSILIEADEYGVSVSVGAIKGSLWQRVKYAFNHVFGEENGFADTIMETPEEVDVFIKHLEDAKAKLIADMEREGIRNVNINGEPL